VGNIYKFVLALRGSEIKGRLPGTVFVYRRKGDIFYDVAPYITKAEGLRILMDFVGINPRESILGFLRSAGFPLRYLGPLKS